MEYGRRVSLAGGNPYRAKAYVRAAENLAVQTESLDCLIREDRLRAIPGVGDAISDIVEGGELMKVVESYEPALTGADGGMGEYQDWEKPEIMARRRALRNNPTVKEVLARSA